MQITLELPEDIAKGLGTRWKDLLVRHWKVWHSKHTVPGAYGGSASQAARFRNANAGGRLFEGTRSLRLDGADFEQTGRHSASSEREKLSFEPALDMVVVADTSPINYSF